MPSSHLFSKPFIQHPGWMPGHPGGWRGWHLQPNLLIMRCIVNVSCCHRTVGSCQLNWHIRGFLGSALFLLCPTQRHAPFSIVVTSKSPRRQHLKKLLFTPISRAVSNLMNQPMALNCWKRILHRSLLFLHVLQMRHWELFVPDHLFQDVYIVNSFGRQRQGLPLGKRAGMLTFQHNKR